MFKCKCIYIKIPKFLERINIDQIAYSVVNARFSDYEKSIMGFH